MGPTHRALILATGAYLPGEPIDNAAMEELVGPLPPDVLEGIQVTRRHWMVDPATGEHLEGNTDMAYKAVVQALDRANVTAAEIDLLLVSTASPEYLLPPMATFLQERLGLRRCATLEVRSGCAGFVEALDVARLYLERGEHTTAVVVGSETISPLLVPIFRGMDPQRIRMRDRMNPYNFGDGAGAIVLRGTADEADGGGILGSAIGSVGGQKKPGMQIVGAGTHAPVHEQLEAKRFVELKVDVVESGRFTPHVLMEGLIDTLEAADVTADDIGVCIIPEGNAGYMTDELQSAGLLTPEWKSIEPRIVENLADVGATGSAATPLALDHAVTSGAISQGDLVMLLAIETSKWKYAGTVVRWTAPPVPDGTSSATEG